MPSVSCQKVQSMAALRAHLWLLLLFCYSTGFIFAIRRYTKDDVIKLRYFPNQKRNHVIQLIIFENYNINFIERKFAECSSMLTIVI